MLESTLIFPDKDHLVSFLVPLSVRYWLRSSDINFFSRLFINSKSVIFFLKASALWANSFHKSIYPCVSSLLRSCLNVFLPPLSKVGCPKNFRDSESLGKSNGKKWSHFWQHLLVKGVKSSRNKKLFFSGKFTLKTHK